jgi:hypothetical protein
LHYAKALKKEKEAREKEGRKHSIDMLLNNQVCVCVLHARMSPSSRRCVLTMAWCRDEKTRDMARKAKQPATSAKKVTPTAN